MKKIKLSELATINNPSLTDKILLNTSTGAKLIDKSVISPIERDAFEIPAGAEIDTGISKARALRVYWNAITGYFLLGATVGSVAKIGETTAGTFGANAGAAGSFAIYLKNTNGNIFVKNNTVSSITIIAIFYKE